MSKHSSAALPTVYIAGVNDEPSPTWDLDEGLDVLAALGIGFVELRAAHGQTVDQMDDATFKTIVRRVRERNFSITTYLGRLGQCVPDEDARHAESELMKRAVERADLAGARQIRIMGYKRGPEPGDWQARAVEIFVRLAQIAAGADKVLVFENPPGGDAAVGSAAECLSALQAVDSPHFRLNLDPGNFGARGDDPLQAFEMLRGFVGNVHVKDIRTAGDTSTYCVAGEGICNYPETFRGLREDGYSGFVTAEPHLSHAQSYHTSGREGFSHAARTMIELLESAGYKLIKAPE